MKRSKLEKAKGRYQSGEHFARLPRQVIEGHAYCALPDYTKAVLVALAAQFHGIGNGDLSLTWPVARALGVSSEWKLRAGLKLLERIGLCEMTRPGENVAGGQKIPTLYALGWLPIEKSGKFDQMPGTMRQAPNRWAAWVRPDDWDAQTEQVRRRAQGKNRPRYTREGESAPLGRNDESRCRITREAQESESSATHGGATSQDLGRDIDMRALRLIRAQPNLTDFDVARAMRFNVDPLRVRALREGARA